MMGATISGFSFWRGLIVWGVTELGRAVEYYVALGAMAGFVLALLASSITLRRKECSSDKSA